MNKIKIAYSMVTYDLKADQNYEHDVDFLKTLSNYADIFLIIERGRVAPNIKAPKIYVQKSNSIIFRIIEHFFIIFKIRLKGVRVFYSRNSLMNAVIAGFITRFSGGDTYFWSCGEILKGRETTKKEKGVWGYFFEFLAYFLTFNLIKGLITGTNNMKNYYINEVKINPNKIFVLPNWVDLNRFNFNKEKQTDIRKKLSIPENAFILLFPRSLSKRHGTLFLPKILKSLRERGIDAYLVASGRGKLNSWLKENTKLNGTQKFLRILGGVPNIDMPHFYNVSNVCIVPSETEGFPRVLLESMAMGVPFVAHSVGGITDIISKNQNSLVVPLGKLNSFVNVLERIHFDSSWNKRIIKEGKIRVKQFNVSRVVESFFYLFKKSYKNSNTN